MTAEGLPLSMRQERDESAGSQDILAGKDFLSVFLKSSGPRTYDSYRDTEEELQASYDYKQFTDRDSALPETTTDRLAAVFDETTLFDSFIRTSRDTAYSYESSERQPSSSLITFSTSDPPSSEESVIVAVRVSSSVDRQISKNNQLQRRTKSIFSTTRTLSNQFQPLSVLDNTNKFSSTISNVPQILENNNAQLGVIDKNNGDSTKTNANNKGLKDIYSENNSFGYPTKNVFVSSQDSSLLARSNDKRELIVDEAEPTTHNRENRNNRDLTVNQPNTGFPVPFPQTSDYPSLPTAINISFNLSDFLKSNDKGSQLQPFHHSFIYHDVPQDSAKGRSVSYSTLIQAVAPGQEETVQYHMEQESRYNIPTNLEESSQDVSYRGYAKSVQNSDNQPKENIIQNHKNYFNAQFTSTNAPLTISNSTSIAVSSDYHDANQENSYSQQTETSTHLTQLTNDNWSSAYSQSSPTQTESSTITNNKSKHWRKFFSLSGTIKNPQQNSPTNPLKFYGRPEQNYEIDEAVSVHTNGRTHGIQLGAKHTQQDSKSGDKPTESPNDKDKKTGYVEEGRNYRRYRVEEKTPDGFIVGEYGVVSNDDGSLRGVRYTADGSINPSVIYNALMKFLSL